MQPATKEISKEDLYINSVVACYQFNEYAAPALLGSCQLEHGVLIAAFLHILNSLWKDNDLPQGAAIIYRPWPKVAPESYFGSYYDTLYKFGNEHIVNEYFRENKLEVGWPKGGDSGFSDWSTINLFVGPYHCHINPEPEQIIDIGVVAGYYDETCTHGIRHNLELEGSIYDYLYKTATEYIARRGNNDSSSLQIGKNENLELSLL